jgi:hypothetical protein
VAGKGLKHRSPLERGSADTLREKGGDRGDGGKAESQGESDRDREGRLLS